MYIWIFSNIYRTILKLYLIQLKIKCNFWQLHDFFLNNIFALIV